MELQDFVYVVKRGQVVEQSFRGDLEEDQEWNAGRGEFRRMMASQGQGGQVPVVESELEEKVEEGGYMWWIIITDVLRMDRLRQVQCLRLSIGIGTLMLMLSIRKKIMMHRGKKRKRKRRL
jgi:hypothetical protein